MLAGAPWNSRDFPAAPKRPAMQLPSANLPSELERLSDAAREEWFLNRMAEPTLPFDALVAILASFEERGHVERATACADLLHETLAQRGEEERLLDLWELRAAWQAENPGFAAACADRLGTVFRGQPRMELFLRAAGFGGDPAPAECLRRLRVLRGLQPGALCWEKTWGLGTVAAVMEFEQSVRIDFETKKGHVMALAYAARTLDLLPEDHLLARHRNDPAGFAEWLKTDPAGVVKSALGSFGPLSAPALQALLAGRIFPETDWKRFWDAARKQLKSDPQVEFPARRNDPIRLLEAERKFDAAWLAELASERDLDAILRRIEAWKAAARGAGTADPPAAVRDRLAFILQGADKTQVAAGAHALLLADDFNLLALLPAAAERIRAWSDPETFASAFQRVPPALGRRLLGFLDRRDRDTTAGLLLRALPDLPMAPFNEAMDALLSGGSEARAAEALRAILSAGRATPEMIAWLSRRPDFAAKHTLCPMGTLLLEALRTVENEAISGERLKAKHQVRKLLEQADWLAAALGNLEALDLRQFIGRLRHSPAWPAVERHALLYRLAQRRPSLQPFLEDDSPPAPASAPRRRLTSHRSYRERQAQLHKLVTEEIPKNSQEIAAARSYGDLSENYEYKAAKEAQGLLMRRRQELESQLDAVTGTDFEGFPAKTAGIGARVVLEHGSGRRETYTILGEWDSDESLGIISCQSRLAEALRGHGPGEQVVIPDETGQATVTLLEVAGLPPEIKAWIRGP